MKAEDPLYASKAALPAVVNSTPVKQISASVNNTPSSNYSRGGHNQRSGPSRGGSSNNSYSGSRAGTPQSNGNTTPQPVDKHDFGIICNVAEYRRRGESPAVTPSKCEAALKTGYVHDPKFIYQCRYCKFRGHPAQLCPSFYDQNPGVTYANYEAKYRDRKAVEADMVKRQLQV